MEQGKLLEPSATPGTKKNWPKNSQTALMLVMATTLETGLTSTLWLLLLTARLIAEAIVSAGSSRTTQTQGSATGKLVRKHAANGAKQFQALLVVAMARFFHQDLAR